MQLNHVGPVIQELHENLLLNIVDTKLALDGLEQDDHSLSLLLLLDVDHNFAFALLTTLIFVKLLLVNLLQFVVHLLLQLLKVGIGH